MRIGQFGDSFWPVVDGVGRVMYGYAEALTEMGHEVVTVAPRYTREPFPVRGASLLTYPSARIPRTKPYRAGFPRLDPIYARRIGGVGLDIAHAHSPFMAGGEARRVARARGIPLVGTFHSKFYEDFYKVTRSKAAANAAKSRVVRFFRSCDEVWAVNKGTAETLAEYGFGGEVIVVPNGVKRVPPLPEYVDLARRSYGGSRGLLFVGNINWKKNIRTILEGFALLVGGGMDLRLTMAGQGPDERGARELAEALGVGGRVAFAGHITDFSVLNGWYAAADLFVFPSDYDCAPLSLREAAAAGTPAVMLKGSDAADVITHGENGFLCGGGARAFADAVAEALARGDLADIGARAREGIAMDIRDVAAEVERRYERLVGLKAGAGR